jgi:hypothetical protein
MKSGLRIFVLISAMLPWCATVSAEPLGRLFFTPAQRNTLDAGKQLATSRKAAPSGPRTATLNGVVTRSDGESTVWVNGQAVGGNGAPAVNASASASNPAAARVELRGARNPVKLKVGQRFDRSTGRVAESYESATVDAKPSVSEPAQQESADRPPVGNRNRGRTAGTSDRNSDRPTDD